MAASDHGELFAHVGVIFNAVSALVLLSALWIRHMLGMSCEIRVLV